ncbi:D-xylose ABC transporter ATP-binding protein, partial [Pseudomonas syringae]|nr:D-xylose ABC transporter ATP-binding protein [Pseudomonas syringae]
MFGSATANPPAQRDLPSGDGGSEAPDVQAPYLLEISHVSKGFPGVIALNDVQLRVRPGSVLA